MQVLYIIFVNKTSPIVGLELVTNRCFDTQRFQLPVILVQINDFNTFIHEEHRLNVTFKANSIMHRVGYRSAFL